MRAVCQGTHYPLFEVTCSLFGNLVFLFIPPGLQSLATSFNTKLLLMSSTVSKLQGMGLLMSGQFIPSSQSLCLEGEWVTWWCQNLGWWGEGSGECPECSISRGAHLLRVLWTARRSEKEIHPEYSLVLRELWKHICFFWKLVYHSYLPTVYWASGTWQTLGLVLYVHPLL